MADDLEITSLDDVEAILSIVVLCDVKVFKQTRSESKKFKKNTSSDPAAWNCD